MAIAKIDRASLTPNGNGTASAAQEPVHLPEKLPLRFTLHERIRRWSHMVVKKDDGDYRISKGIAGFFISAFLGLAVTAGLGLLWQRDEIVRLRTVQEIQEKSQERVNADIMSKVDQARNFATIADKNAARLEGKFDQFAQQYGIKNGGRGDQ